MKRPYRLWLLTAVTIFAGCRGGSLDSATPGKAAESKSVLRVKVGTPKRESIRLTTTQPAKIEAFEEAPLYSKVAGYVDAVPVDIGDRVKSGTVLVRLRAPELLDEVEQKKALRDQADAEVAQSKATLAATEAEQTTTLAKVREANAGVTRADADFARWKAEHQRISELASGGSVTRKLADEALNSLRSSEASQKEAAARLESAEAMVKEANAKIEKAKSDVTAAEARLKVAESNIEQAGSLASYLEIKAPFDGCVTQRNVDTGHFVQPAGATGSKPLLIIAETKRIRISLDVPEREAGFADKDDSATISIPSLRGATLTGKLARTSWALDNANRSLRAEIDFDNSEGRLRPGMFATVEVVLAKSENALTVPNSAVVKDGLAASVFVVQSNRISRVPVTLGLSSGGRQEVLEGLNETQTIVLSDVATLQDGAEVESVTDAPKP